MQGKNKYASPRSYTHKTKLPQAPNDGYGWGQGHEAMDFQHPIQKEHVSGGALQWGPAGHGEQTWQ